MQLDPLIGLVIKHQALVGDLFKALIEHPPSAYEGQHILAYIIGLSTAQGGQGATLRDLTESISAINQHATLVFSSTSHKEHVQ